MFNILYSKELKYKYLNWHFWSASDVFVVGGHAIFTSRYFTILKSQNLYRDQIICVQVEINWFVRNFTGVHTQFMLTRKPTGDLWEPDLLVVTIHVKVHKLCYSVLPDTAHFCLLPPQLYQQQSQFLWLQGRQGVTYSHRETWTYRRKGKEKRGENTPGQAV